MIVREIKTHPEIIRCFDWFNDYDDTRSWAVRNCPEAVQALDTGYREWLIKLRDRQQLIDFGPAKETEV